MNKSTIVLSDEFSDYLDKEINIEIILCVEGIMDEISAHLGNRGGNLYYNTSVKTRRAIREKLCKNFSTAVKNILDI